LKAKNHGSINNKLVGGKIAHKENDRKRKNQTTSQKMASRVEEPRESPYTEVLFRERVRERLWKNEKGEKRVKRGRLWRCARCIQKPRPVEVFYPSGGLLMEEDAGEEKKSEGKVEIPGDSQGYDEKKYRHSWGR